MTRTDIHKALFGWLPVEWQDAMGKIRRYSLFGEKGSGNAIIACVDGTSFHGGLADRWKGIVSLYALAKATGRDFRIRYTFPFDLTEFQIPATYDWRLREGEWSNRTSRVCLKRVIGEPSIRRMSRLPQDKQIHCYANRDWIDEINAHFQTTYTWGELFEELFQPTEHVRKALEPYIALLPESYIAVAFRLQNLFGDFTEYKYAPTNTVRQKEIIRLCRSYLEQICSKGQAAHADTMQDAPREQYRKSFVDFYLLANAQEVYCAGTKEMYPSEFPQYAAKVHNRPFTRVRLD